MDRVRDIKARIDSGERLINDYRQSGYPEYASTLRREIDDLKLQLYIAEQEALP